MFLITCLTVNGAGKSRQDLARQQRWEKIKAKRKEAKRKASRTLEGIHREEILAKYYLVNGKIQTRAMTRNYIKKHNYISKWVYVANVINNNVVLVYVKTAIYNARISLAPVSSSREYYAIEMPTKGLIDDQRIGFMYGWPQSQYAALKPSGTYSYLTVMNARKTVPKFKPVPLTEICLVSLEYYKLHKQEFDKYKK